jgi:hypothetical protein
MQLGDPRANATAYLILRHLYDGDIIDWPIPPDHPQKPIFDWLETQGYVARWDRMWPLHDRYRLTEKGIATIEAVYRPAGADTFFDDLRARNLAPQQRRQWLQSRQLDPILWPVLHDPATHWSTYGAETARWLAYIWEDQSPAKRRRRPAGGVKAGKGGGGGGRVVHHVVHHVHYVHRDPHLVDLDREVDDTGIRQPTGTDYDVS